MRVIMAGCGNMGFAMLKAWIAGGVLAPGDCTVVEPAEALRARAAAQGVTAVAEAVALPDDLRADVVVLAVKPQVMGDAAPAYRRFAEAGATIVSIAAGTRVATLQSLVGEDAAIVRCMPNTPAAIGQGMMVTFANGRVAPSAMDAVNMLLAQNGAVTSIPSEDLMDAVTAVSGSGPAYVFHFIEALTAAGEKAGLPAETADLLARQTVLGAAKLAFESGEAPGTLREQVTSPNGTTAAALAVLMGDNRLKTLVEEAIEAARARSVELGA